MERERGMQSGLRRAYAEDDGLTTGEGEFAAGLGEEFLAFDDPGARAVDLDEATVDRGGNDTRDGSLARAGATP